MSEMKKYMKVVRHGKSGTHLTLQPGNNIVIQEKLDGANASFKRENNNIECFSRNVKLDKENTLRGFYNWVQENISVEDLDSALIYFGEWLVPHTIQYPEDKYYKFYLFDIYNTETEKYMSFDFVKSEANNLGLNVVPVFYEGEFKSIDHLKEFVGVSQVGENGEGIVIKNTDYHDKHGNQQFTKIVADKFAEKAKVKKQNVSSGKDSLEVFLDTYLTNGRIEKTLNKLVDENVIDKSYGVEDMGTILKESVNRIYEDIIEEELDSLLKQLKKKVGKRYPAAVKQVLLEQNRM